jgi:hypothetical protein
MPFRMRAADLWPDLSLAERLDLPRKRHRHMKPKLPRLLQLRAFQTLGELNRTGTRANPVAVLDARRGCVASVRGNINRS